MFIIENLFLGIMSGIVSGFLTGFLVYGITKKRENEYRAFHNLRSFIFASLEKCEIHIPVDILKDLKTIDKKNEKLKAALTEIIDYIYPENSENTEYSEKDIKLFNNITIALEELNHIQKKKRL